MCKTSNHQGLHPLEYILKIFSKVIKYLLAEIPGDCQGPEVLYFLCNLSVIFFVMYEGFLWTSVGFSSSSKFLKKKKENILATLDQLSLFL